jgi:acylphosphatase
MAEAEGLAGWCKNLPDGRVEACFEGDPAAVDEALAWCRAGPASAIVTSVDVTPETPQGERGFRLG